MKGAGGTPGGIGEFLGGFVMAVAGGWLLTNQVTVSSGYWSWFGPHTFGLSLLPLVVGSGFLFFDGKSVVGWVLTLGGATIILVGILVTLRIDFERTTLFNTLAMLILLAGGIGLMARAMRAKG